MRRLNKVTALVIAGVISCTSPMMVMASDSSSVMSQAEEILKDNEVGSLASDPDKVGDIIVYVKGLFDSNQITDDEISQGIDEAADHFGVSLNEDDKSSLVNIISKFRGIEMSDDQIKGYVDPADPVPYLETPGLGRPKEYMVADQRFLAGRTKMRLCYVS